MAQTVVNTTTTGDQSGPVTVATNDGGYFTAWYDDTYSNPAGQLRGQYFDANGNPIGSELALGTGADVEGNDSIDLPTVSLVLLGNGNVLATWLADNSNDIGDSGNSVVYGAIANSDGTTTSVLGDGPISDTSVDSSPPVTVATSDGGFFVAYYADGFDNPAGQLFGRFYEASGDPIGLAFTIGDAEVEGSNTPNLPSVSLAALNNGDVAVTWLADNSNGLDGSNSIPVRAIATNDGTTGSAGPQSNIPTTSSDNSPPISVATNDGGFFTAWYDDGFSDPGGQLRGQYFDVNGNPIGSELAIGTAVVEGDESGDLPYVDLTVLNDGNVVVSWLADDINDIDDSGSANVVHAIATSDGTTTSVGTQSTVSLLFTSSPPVTVATNDGGFFTAWYADGFDDEAGTVRGRFFDANKVPVGSEQVIGMATVDGYDSVDVPALNVTVLNGGKIVVSWRSAFSENVDGAGSAVVNDILCFAAGTHINVPGRKDPKKVEDLAVGDLIQTAENGCRPIRWIGVSKLGASDLMEKKMLPVRILAGALGGGLPRRDLLVSRQHRILVSSKIALRMFGCRDVLIPAIRLTELPGIFVDESVQEIEYFHILFDQHEIIFAEGAPTESLFTGPEALKALTPEAKWEILTLFPEVAELDYAPEPARFIPEGKRQRQLIDRHLKNNKELLQTM